MGLKKFTGEVVKEGKRVRWPKREELIPAIVTVIVISVFVGLILWLEDWGGNSLKQILESAFAGLKTSSSAASDIASNL